MFTPVLAKHTKHLSLVDILAVGVDRMQRNFEPMRHQQPDFGSFRRFLGYSAIQLADRPIQSSPDGASLKAQEERSSQNS